MKSAILSLATLLLPLTASAVDYITHAVWGGTGPKTLTVDPSSLVEISGQAASGTAIGISLTFSDDTTMEFNANLVGVVLPPMKGVTQITTRHLGSSRGVATFKITPEAEINVVAPGTVLVLPEDTTGNFDVIIEKSDDLVNWMPFFSQTVNSTSSSRFFRTRVTKTPAP